MLLGLINLLRLILGTFFVANLIAKMIFLLGLMMGCGLRRRRETIGVKGLAVEGSVIVMAREGLFSECIRLVLMQEITTQFRFRFVCGFGSGDP